ncbi:MAG TPA: efflux RND transporter periplasmic adaptor subunit [Candidatus Accumulibacter phosphatis]|nr:efflux RND transporter periplasmic adaptor subunit [Candidatus Accumulibacter phosphatis]
MKNPFAHRLTGLVALALAGLILGGCGKSEAPQAPASKSASVGHAGDTHAATEKPDAHEGEDDHGEAEPIKLSLEEIQADGIKIEDLAEQALSEQLVLTATIHPNQERITHVSPRVPGRIVKVEAKLGDLVKTGQTLAVLDSLEVGEAHSNYLQARSQHAVAKADFERAEKLHADEIIAQKDHQRAHAEYQKSKAALAAASDRLRMLGVSSASSSDGRAVSTFPLTTPFAGTVIEKHAILGELAQPDKSVFTVADLSSVWIEANLFEKDLAKARVGADASVTVAAYPGEVFKGQLTYIASVMDKETRTVQARVEIANTDGRMKPEMFATATINTTGTGDEKVVSKSLLVPSVAVVLMDGKPTVFVQDDDGFEPRGVTLGEKVGQGVVVEDGLKAGDRVVTAGAYTLKARIMKSQLGSGHGH